MDLNDGDRVTISVFISGVIWYSSFGLWDMSTGQYSAYRILKMIIRLKEEYFNAVV